MRALALLIFSVCLASGAAKLPLAFETNQGQAPSGEFVAHTRGFAVSLRSGNLDMTAQHGHVSSRLLGARAASPQAEESLPLKVGYFRGQDPSRWIKNVPTWSRVRYRNIYPGIDIVYYGNAGALEYDFILAPGADASKIAVQYNGARSMRVNAAGDLEIETGDGPLVMHKPSVYQEIGGTRRTVEGSYALSGNTARFALGSYDHARALVIDPTITWGTYLSALTGTTEIGEGMVTDAAGNVYVVGSMVSIYGDADIFFCKFGATGTPLVLNYYGGSYDDYGHGIAVDATGAMYLTGETDSYDYPADYTYDQYAGYTDDAFISKIDPTGQTLIYSHFFGGTGSDMAYAIALDSATNAYIAGATDSTDFPVSQGSAQTANAGGYDGFVVKFNAAGTAVYSTFFGGSGNDGIYSIAADSSGDVFATGQTLSTNFPVTSGVYQPKLNGTSDAFAAKFAPATGSLVFSTLLGGSGDDAGNAIAIDGGGAMYITGETLSPDFPAKGAPQSTYGGAGDAFFSKLSGDGQTLIYSTYLGGSGEDYGNSIAVDSNGNAYITGGTASTDFPVSANPLQATNLATTNGIVAGLSPDGSTVLFATYLGGDGVEGAAGDYGVAISYSASQSSLVLVGVTSSDNFPATTGAAATTFLGGSSNAFVAQLTTDTGAPPTSGGATGSNGRSGLGVHRIGGTADRGLPKAPTHLEFRKPKTKLHPVG